MQTEMKTPTDTQATQDDLIYAAVAEMRRQGLSCSTQSLDGPMRLYVWKKDGQITSAVYADMQLLCDTTITNVALTAYGYTTGSALADNFDRIDGVCVETCNFAACKVCSSLPKSYITRLPLVPLQPPPLQLLGAPRLGLAQ